MADDIDQMNSDSRYMKRCLQLAKLGAGFVAPNPMVGSVLVYDNRIIGEGYHKIYGHEHAEVNCINDAAIKFAASNNSEVSFDQLLQNSTIYVSLEPCAHFGKTPPCADLIISKKIPKVVIGCRDPFEQVDSKGIEKLLAAGITVKSGVKENECKEINKRFFTFHIKKRPFIILKWAQSADRKIAGDKNSRVFITNEITNRVVHKWRTEEASILVGTNTALIDDPSLTNRLWSGNNSVRLVLDRNLRLPYSLKLFDGTVKTVIFNIHKHEETDGIVYYKIEDDMPIAEQVCNALYLMNIQSVLIEGGTTLLQTFINENLWDEARVITNESLIIGHGLSSPEFIAEKFQHSTKIDTDTIRYYNLKSPTGS